MLGAGERMGIRGELFSTRVALANRTYFFNVKENRAGDLYLNIVESKNNDDGGFDRQSVVVFASDTQEFLRGFDEALRVMEKSARGRKAGLPGVARTRAGEAEKRHTAAPKKKIAVRKKHDSLRSPDKP